MIKEASNELSLAVTINEWELLRRVAQNKKLTGEDEYQTLLRSMFVFEYRNEQGDLWFDVNPILAEIKE